MSRATHVLNGSSEIHENATEDELPAERHESSRNGSSSESKVNILMVDDREDKLLALEAVLGNLGQNLIKARSGKEALRQLLSKEFAVILLDVSMPTMDGFETAAMMRQRPSSEHTPIIFITSMNNSDNQISRGYSLGAVDYILTPIVPDVLRTKVSVFVELHRKTEKIKQQAELLLRIEEADHKRQLAAAQDRIELETKRNRFFNLSVDLLAIADFDGHFLQINPSWEKVLGFSEEELKARSGLEFVHPEDRAAMEYQLASLKRGATVSFEGRYLCKNGGYRWLGWTAAPFESEKLLYIFARDITARKSSEEEIRGLNHELEKRVGELTDINRELESFCYSISHDLRAPLRAMQGFASTLLHDYGPKLDDDGKDFARRIVNSSMFMDKLLHDLLDYSRLSRAQCEPAAVNVPEVLDEILEQIEKEIDEKQAEIQIHCPLAVVAAHPPTLRQILYNLISNALKFIPPQRTPTIRIWTESHSSMVRICIQDNGIGIAPEHHEKIFGLFERLHGNHVYSGTGIGLAIVRKGAERMNGRVGLESKPGEGSCFWFELPAAAVAELQAVAG